MRVFAVRRQAIYLAILNERAGRRGMVHPVTSCDARVTSNLTCLGCCWFADKEVGMEDEKKSVQQTTGTKRTTRGRKTAPGDAVPLAEEGGEALEIPRAKRPGRRKAATAVDDAPAVQDGAVKTESVDKQAEGGPVGVELIDEGACAMVAAHAAVAATPAEAAGAEEEGVPSEDENVGEGADSSEAENAAAKADSSESENAWGEADPTRAVEDEDGPSKAVSVEQDAWTEGEDEDSAARRARKTCSMATDSIIGDNIFANDPLARAYPDGFEDDLDDEDYDEDEEDYSEDDLVTQAQSCLSDRWIETGSSTLECDDGEFDEEGDLGRYDIHDPHQLGKLGEHIAARYLRRWGYKILERNYRTAAGEADLVCVKDDTVVLVEVKTRLGADALPEDAITAEKIRKYRRITLDYLRTHEWFESVRLDALAINIVRPRRAQVHHFMGICEWEG